LISIFFAISLILLIATLPLYAWPLTRRLALPATLLFILFLVVHLDFVLGITGVYHDTFWSTEVMATVMRQWLESNTDLGWNPYLGGGQPIEIFNNLFNIFPPVFFFYLFKLFGLELSSKVFFNLIFLFCHFNLCVGSLLLIRLLIKNSYICILGFISILFGGLFQSELGCPLGLLYLNFLPYLLFFLIHFFKYGRIESMVFFFLLFGISSAYYIPLYHTITVALFLSIAALACFFGAGPDYRKKFSRAVRRVITNPRAIVFSLVLFVIAAGSTFYSYAEIQDYVSPTRGYTLGGELGEKNYVRPVEVSLNHYERIMNFYSPRPGDVYLNTHIPFYLGILPALGFFISIFLIRNQIFTFLAILIFLLSLGDQTPVWGWMTHDIPILNILRNSFPFSLIATFIILLGSLLGLSALFNDDLSPQRKLAAVLISSVFLVAISDGILIAFLTPAILVLILICLSQQLKLPNINKLGGFLLLALGAAHLVGFNIQFAKNMELYMQTLYTESGRSSERLTYPASWQFYPAQYPPLPFNLYPLLNKTAAWSVHHPIYSFYLQKDFADYLVEEKLLPVNVKERFQVENYGGPIFRLLPKTDDWIVSGNNISIPKENVNNTFLPSKTMSEFSWRLPTPSPSSGREKTAEFKFHKNYSGPLATVAPGQSWGDFPSPDGRSK